MTEHEKYIEHQMEQAAHDEACAERDAQDLQSALQEVLNRYSAENASDTPDFILAEYITGCLAAFDQAVRSREKWYGRRDFV